MTTVIVILNIATALVAIASAFCWQCSCTIAVPHPHAKHDGAYRDGTISGDGSDFLATVKAQAKWNRRAALTACIAALLQASVAGISAVQ